MINLRQFQKFYSTLRLFAQESFKGNTRVVTWFITFFSIASVAFILLLKYVYKTPSYADAETVMIMNSLYLSSIFMTVFLGMLLSVLTVRPSSKMIIFLRTSFVDEEVIVLVIKFLKLVTFILFFSFFNMTQSIPLITTLSLGKCIYLISLAYLIAISVYFFMQIIVSIFHRIKYSLVIEVTIYTALLTYNLIKSFQIGEAIFNSNLFKSTVSQYSLSVIAIAFTLALVLLIIHIFQKSSLKFTKSNIDYIKFANIKCNSYFSKFAVMTFSQPRNSFIYFLHIVLLIVCFKFDQTLTFIIPSLLLPITLGLYSSTTKDRSMNYLHGISATKELRAIYMVLLILLAPYIVISLSNLNLVVVKGVMFNLNMLVASTAIGYTFPQDTSVINNFASNFIIIFLLVINILIFSLDSISVSLILNLIVCAVANIVLALELQRKEGL